MMTVLTRFSGVIFFLFRFRDEPRLSLICEIVSLLSEYTVFRTRTGLTRNRTVFYARNGFGKIPSISIAAL